MVIYEVICFITFTFVIPCSSSGSHTLQFHALEEPFEVEKTFLSFCLDPYLKHDLPAPWGNFSFDNEKVLTLAHGLSPAILRWGGTDADWSIFYPNHDAEDKEDVPNKREWNMKIESNLVWQMTQSDKNPKSGFIVPIYKKDIDNLRKLAQAAGGKLLFDLNIQMRKGDDWDPTNAEELLSYIAETTKTPQVEDVVFELGNEWPYPEYHPSPERLVQDFLQFNKTLFSNSKYSKSFIVGPDIGHRTGWEYVIGNFSKYLHKTVKAFTLHHYYFKGPGADISEYFNIKKYNSLEAEIVSVRSIINNAGGSDLPLWLGETSDSYDKGTPGITNKFAGGFLWLDKLGLAAKLRVALVARQDFYGGNYPFLDESLNPNPDYWASYVYKQLMGTKVLTYNNTAIGEYTRVYAHCTSTKVNYMPGSITVMILNIGDTESLPFYFQQGDSSFVYSLVGEGSLLSSTVLLNGKRLSLVNDSTLPTLDPVKRNIHEGIVFAPKSINFVILNDAGYEYCKV